MGAPAAEVDQLMWKTGAILLLMFFSRLFFGQTPILTGKFRAVMVPVPLDAAFISRNIPPELIYRGPDKTWGLMPIGHQAKVQIAGMPLSFDYNEMVLALPHIYHRDGRGPFSHLVRLYLDNQVAIFGGRFFYGMPKEYAKYHYGKNEVSIKKDGMEVLKLVAYSDGEFMEASHFPGFSPVEEILRMPMIQKKSCGELVISQFDWGLDTGKFLLRAIQSGKLEVGKFDPVLPFKKLNLMGLDDSRVGAFEFTSVWRLSPNE